MNSTRVIWGAVCLFLAAVMAAIVAVYLAIQYLYEEALVAIGIAVVFFFTAVSLYNGWRDARQVSRENPRRRKA